MPAHATVQAPREVVNGLGALGVQPPLGEQSETDLLEGQQPHNECVDLGRIAHVPPVDESALGSADDVQRLDARDLPPHVVVRVAAVLLQVNKGRADTDDLVLERQSVKARTQLGPGDRTSGSSRGFGLVVSADEDVGPQSGRAVDHFARDNLEAVEHLRILVFPLDQGPDPDGGIVCRIDALFDEPRADGRREVVQFLELGTDAGGVGERGRRLLSPLAAFKSKSAQVWEKPSTY